jgi:hypothetical protein
MANKAKAPKLKAWLKPNMLTDDPSDFNVVIESFGSIAPNGIIDELVKEGMELKRETALDVISRYNRKSIELALQGYNVNNGIVYMRAAVKGVFFDKKWNPEQHKLYMSVQQGADLRTAVAGATVEIMGEHPDPMSLFNVTDKSTGTTDVVTRGFNMELKGTYIKIAGDDPKCGIYFISSKGNKATKIDPKYIAVNDPSKIMIIVPPDLEPGMYEVSIITQYTAGSKALKSPRSTNLGYMVEVV